MRQKPVKEYKNVLDTEAIGRLMFKLSGPVFMGMFVQALYNIISTVFIGHYVGPLGIAGLSIAFPLQMMGFGLGSLSGIGGMSLISRALGARENERAEKSLGNGILLSLVLSVIIVVVLLPFMDFWLKLIGASEEVLPYAHDYMIYVGIAILFQIVSISLLNFARAEGNARVGMVAMVSGALLSIAFSFVFIVWMDMGVEGAGLAVLLAQLVATGYLALYYWNSNSYLKVRRANLRPDFGILKEMLAIGFGAFAQMFAGSLSVMILINMVAHHGGDFAVGAFGIVQRVLMFANMPAMVLSQGAQPIIGFNYGAKRFGLLLKSVYLGLVTATVLSVAGFLVVYFVPEAIMRVFSDDAELISLGADASRRMLLSLPLIAPISMGTMIFQAIGKARQAFIAAIARPVLFLIPAVFILSHFFGLNGIWFTFPVSDVFTLSLVVILIVPIIKSFRAQAGGPQGGVPARQSPPVLQPEESPTTD
jgi:putative MATE family efflux protein